MREITIRLQIPRGLLKRALAVVLLAAAAGELGSENVTLTTYYPAPSGIYTKMITTGDTVLARDGGSLTAGSASHSTTFTLNGGASVTGSVSAASLSASGAASAGTLQLNAAATPGAATGNYGYANLHFCM